MSINNDNFNISDEDKNKKLDKLYEKKDEITNQYISRIQNIDWKYLYFNSYGPTCLQRFKKIIEKFEIKDFIQGLKYEYGYDKTEINYEIAYSIYKNAADNSTDYLSMYKMYIIHLNPEESKKFNIKSDKILEVYYLVKCISYLPFSQLNYSRTLNQIDPLYDFALHLDLEDSEATKFFSLIDLLKDNSKYNIATETLTYIKTLISYQFEIGETNMYTEVLENLAKNNNLEAIYKYACILVKEKSDNNKANELFKILEKNKYYRSFPEYSIFLFNELSQYDKSLDILKIGSLNGIFECYALYYMAYAYFIDFEELFTNSEKLLECIESLEYLINTILSGEVIYTTELFWFLDIFYKNYKNSKKIIESKYSCYIDEIYSFLNKVYEDENYVKYFSSETYSLLQCLSALAVIHTKGILQNGKKNLTEAQKLLKQSFKIQTSWPKSYNYSLLYKIRKQFFLSGNLTKEKLEKTEKKLFKMYDSRLSDKILNYSVFYSLGKLYENGVGTKQDYEMAYILFRKGVDYSTIIINCSIVSYYRKYKCINILKKEVYQKIEKEFNNFSLRIINYNYNSLSSDDNDYICTICYTNLHNLILYPCKHMICQSCYEYIKANDTCPFCRRRILITKHVKFTFN